MKLSEQDAALFFELMWGLQYYVNQTLQILPNVKSLQQYSDDLSLEDKMKVRDALYTNPSVIDGFLQENPQGLAQEHLAIVEQWKHFVAGDFFIERILKKYTIFISSSNVVYGVFGLHDDFDELFDKRDLPLLVKAVLLPFKNCIVYDGLFQGYSLFFGSGISGELKEIYLTAKQNGQIVEQITGEPPHPAPSLPTKAHPDWKPDLDELAAIAKKLRGGSGQPAVYSPAFSLIRASIELGQVAVSSPGDAKELYKSLNKVEQALRTMERSLPYSARW